MNRLKNIVILALIITFIFTMTDIALISNPVTAQAATMNINKKSLSLKVGEKAQLKITSTKQAVKWSSQNKKIASVNTKGKVSAVATGKTKITATVAGKKFYCSITVTDAPNPALAKAPFNAQEMQILNIDFVMPADWTLDYGLSENGFIATLLPKNATSVSGILINIIPGEKEYKYSDIKSNIATIYTQDYIAKLYTPKYGESGYTITDIVQSDLSTEIGNVLKTQYTLNVNGVALTQQIYDFSIGSLLINIKSMNYDGADLSSMIEYVINSVIVK